MNLKMVPEIIVSNIETVYRRHSGVVEVTPVEEVRNPHNHDKESKESGQDMLKIKSIPSLLISNVTYIFIILSISILWSTPATVIPAHNAIQFPNYWWEAIVTGGPTIALYLAVITVLDWKLFYDTTYTKLLWTFVGLFANALVSIVSCWCVCFLIWTVWLGYNNPMPFVGMICYVITNLSQFIAIWYLFPKEQKTGEHYKKKIWAYIGYRLWQLFYVQQQLALKTVMMKLPLSLQWLVAFVVPVLRELNLTVLKKILKYAVDLDLFSLMKTRLTATITVFVINSFWIAIVVSSLASPATGYSMLAVDFALNVYDTWQIIKLNRKVLPKNGFEKVKQITHFLKKKEETMGLVAVEMIEMLVPIAYIITFIIAFYGKNAELIGGVKFGGWQHKEVDDLISFSSDLMMMFAIDFTALIVSAILLWRYASINLLSEGYNVMKLYCPLISNRIGGTIFLVIIELKSIISLNNFNVL